MPSSRPQHLNESSHVDDFDDDDDLGQEQSSSDVSPLVKGMAGFAVVFIALAVLAAAGYGVWVFLDRPVDPTGRGPGKVAEAPPKGRLPAPRHKGPANDPPENAPIKPVVERETLHHIKEATVFIIMETEEFMSSGSGFVMKVDGDKVWIVTNNHVVEPPPERRQSWGPNLPRPPNFRDRHRRPPFFEPHHPFPPGLGGGFPHFDPRDRLPGSMLPGQPQQRQSARYTVVFRSGMGGEDSYEATVVGATHAPDLAVLQVRGVKEPPEPLDLGSGVEAEADMPVLFLGFPFGLKQAQNQGNPAVTVKEATVSRLRPNGHSGMTVEIQGDVNPGNSGGPLVDTAGRLIGIIFAKYENTWIGLAVHAKELDLVLQPRVGTMSVSAQTVNGVTSMTMAVDVSDPLNMLPHIGFLYVLGDVPKVKADPKTQWEPLPNAKRLKLHRNGLKAIIQLNGEEAKLGQQRFAYQFSYRDRDGQTRYTEPRGFNQK
jgi:S1-C subfamily serine protease